MKRIAVTISFQYRDSIENIRLNKNAKNYFTGNHFTDRPERNQFPFVAKKW